MQMTDLDKRAARNNWTYDKSLPEDASDGLPWDDTVGRAEGDAARELAEWTRRDGPTAADAAASRMPASPVQAIDEVTQRKNTVPAEPQVTPPTEDQMVVDPVNAVSTLSCSIWKLKPP